MPAASLQPVGQRRRAVSPYLFEWQPIVDGYDASGLFFDRVAQGEATFARGGTVATATAVDSTGQIYVAGSQQPRFHHRYNASIGAWNLVGVRVEGSRKNLVLRPENFGASWSAVGSPTRVSAAAVCGVVGLDLIGDDDATALEGYTQTITFTGNAIKAVSCLVRQGSSASSVIRLRDTTASADRLLATITWSGTTPVVTMTTGTNLLALASLPAERLADSSGNAVWRLYFATTAVTAANTNSLQVYPATNAALSVASSGTLYAGGVQAEDALAPSAYIPQTTSLLTRSADAESFAFKAKPQSSTWSLSTVYDGVGGTVLKWEYGTTAYIALALTSAGATVTHSSGSSVSATVLTSLTIGDAVVIRLLIGADGSVNIGVAKNGAAETLSTASAALAFAAAQATPVLRVADTSLVSDFAAVQGSVKVSAGSTSTAGTAATNTVAIAGSASLQVSAGRKRNTSASMAGVAGVQATLARAPKGATSGTIAGHSTVAVTAGRRRAMSVLAQGLATVQATTSGGGVASIVSVNQDWVSTAGGDSIQITCTGVTGTPTFLFGGVAGTTTLVVGNVCTVTVPAGSVGAVNITCSGHTLTNGVEYMQATSSTLTAWHDLTVLSPTVGDHDANGTVTVSTAQAPPGSTHSILCQSTTGAGTTSQADVLFDSLLFDRATYPNDVYLRFKILVPTLTMSRLGTQIKFSLTRGAVEGQPGCYMLAVGSDFASSGSSTQLAIFSDWDTGGTIDTTSGLAFGDGNWITVLMRQGRDTVGSKGYARICFNGKEVTAAAINGVAGCLANYTDYFQQLGMAFTTTASGQTQVFIADILITHGLMLASAVA
jgi:hypothetical protein